MQWSYLLYNDDGKNDVRVRNATSTANVTLGFMNTHK